MSDKKKELIVVDGETLMDMRLRPTGYCIESLLPQGVSMLCGAPKIGKSWLVLDWCVRIAKERRCGILKPRKGLPCIFVLKII